MIRTALLPLLLLAAPSAAERAEPSARAEIVYNSGPYPRLLAWTLSGSFERKGNEWKLELLRELEKMEVVAIERAGRRVVWRPLEGQEEKIRANRDRYYNLLSYSLVLGVLDASIVSIREVDGTAFLAEVKEAIEPAPLLEVALRHFPKELKERYRARTATLLFEKKDGAWTRSRCAADAGPPDGPPR